MAKLGVMRHRITIRATVRADDGGGGTSRADTNFATVWGRVEKASPKEVDTYSQLQEHVTHAIKMRSRSDVKHGQTLYRLRRGATEPTNGTTTEPDGDAFYVISVVDDNEDRPGEFMRIMCEGRSTI